MNLFKIKSLETKIFIYNFSDKTLFYNLGIIRPSPNKCKITDDLLVHVQTC